VGFQRVEKQPKQAQRHMHEARRAVNVSHFALYIFSGGDGEKKGSLNLFIFLVDFPSSFIN
jgi:hypothetical protein